MTIQHDSNLPPLTPKPPPAVPVETLLAINDVTLTAGDIPPGILREFYSRLLGLTFLDADVDTLRFTHDQRIIRLDRNHREFGRLALLISSRIFGDALLRLRDKNIPYELLHTDAGLTRAALLRDPAGNWLHLLETRPF